MLKVWRKMTTGSLLLLAGCASSGPLRYDSLQDYYFANSQDIPRFYPHSDSDAIRHCYAEAMSRQVPEAKVPGLIAAMNKMAMGEALTATDQQMKAAWIDDRPRVEGDTLKVMGENARRAHTEMAMICAPEMLKQ